MQSVGQLEITEGVVETSSDMLSMRLNAIVLEPRSNFR